MAWANQGLDNSVEVASGAITLVEPTGAAAGDLLVALISYRSNTAFTVPSDWNLVDQQSSGNTTVANVASISSGLMMWCVRGASAPTLTIARTGGDVALGSIVRFTGQASSPFDAGAGSTMGTGSTSVTGTGITTAEDNELLIFLGAGARATTWSAFDAATGITGDSGASAQSNAALSTDSWLQRSNIGTTTGADVSNRWADGIQSVAGPTGTLSATQGLSCRSVVIVGAFKMAPGGQPAVKRGSGVPYMRRNPGVWAPMFRGLAAA